VVEAGDAHVNVALAHKGGDITCWKKNDHQWDVLAHRNVDAFGPCVLKAGSLEQFQDLLMQPPLLWNS
jgi:hypothetical protein